MDERDIFLSNEKSKIFYILLLIDNIEKIGYPDIIHFLLHLFFFSVLSNIWFKELKLKKWDSLIECSI